MSALNGHRALTTAPTAEGIVSAGKHLIAAKADVAHGEWLPMLKEIGIDRTMAVRLMAIGGNAGLNDASSHHLPSSVSALYELSRMDPDDIEHGIETGAITPDMTIRVRVDRWRQWRHLIYWH